MDRFPCEILEIIFNEILWKNPEEFYRLRAVSRTWNAVIERSRSKVFQYWYNRCKTEIPAEHLADIVRTKYPLLAHPWQEYYWVDSRLPHVAKTVYEIWKHLPDFHDFTRTDGYNIRHMDWTMHDIVDNPGNCVVGMNDKYLAVTNADGKQWGTRVYRWRTPTLTDSNLAEFVTQYDIRGDKIDFYTTEKGTFVIWAQTSGNHEKIIYISKYAIDNVKRRTTVISLGYVDMYFITQNECFYVIDNDSTGLRTVEHKILTEDGFQTNTVIGEPFTRQGSWCRVEICSSTLYIVQIGTERMWIHTYQISRNSNGKLSFSAENSKVLDYNSRIFPRSYSKIFNHYKTNVNIDNPSLIDSTCSMEQLNSKIYDLYWNDMTVLAAHANYLIANFTGHIQFYQKDDFIEHIENHSETAPDCIEILRFLNLNSRINWIRFVYFGSKVKLLVSYERNLGVVNFAINFFN